MNSFVVGLDWLIQLFSISSELLDFFCDGFDFLLNDIVFSRIYLQKSGSWRVGLPYIYIYIYIYMVSVCCVCVPFSSGCPLVCAGANKSNFSTLGWRQTSAYTQLSQARVVAGCAKHIVGVVCQVLLASLEVFFRKGESDQGCLENLY